jgi:hypothetical protein
VETIRKAGPVHVIITAILIGAAAYVAPAIWATDRTLFGVVSFDQLTFLLSLMLAYAALAVNEAALRTKLALGVIVLFALATVLLLGFSVASVALLVAALLFGFMALPEEQVAARAS